MNIYDKWFICPKCGQRFFKMRQLARIEGVEIKCKRCKAIVIIDENIVDKVADFSRKKIETYETRGEHGEGKQERFIF